MMWKKIAAVFVLLIALLSAICCWLLSNTQLERLANHFLSPDFSLKIAHGIDFGAKGVSVPALTLSSAQERPCDVLSLQNVRADWWNGYTLSVDNVLIDYACLTALPSKENNEAQKTPLNLTALFVMIPDGEAEIRHLQIINAPETTDETLAQLLQANAQLRLHKQNGRLALNGMLREQSVVIFRLDSILENGHLNGRADYNPNPEQRHALDFQLEPAEDLTDLPQAGQLTLNWTRDSFAVPQGLFSLQWRDQQGKAELQDTAQQTELFNLPFRVERDQVRIEKGDFYWNLGEGQPLRGVLNLALKKPTAELLPLKTDIRISLFSEGVQGKGNVVIYGSDGEIGKQRIDIPLEAHGNFKYGTSIAYVDTVFKLEGEYDNPLVRFQDPSKLRVTGRGHDLSLNISIPLAGVQVGRYGVEGRLQAMVQGNTPQFSGLDLHLDGQAYEFIAGIKSIFDIRDTQNRLKATENRVANHWEWTLSGKARAKALNTPLHLQGKGYWTNNHIEIQQLEGYSGVVNTAGVHIPKLELSLTDNIRWYYEEEKIRGMLEARAPFIGLNYGGRFNKPVFGLALDGKDITDFNLAGELGTDGGPGPIKVFAHYYDNKLVGNIYWLEQSAKVFQSLFPNKWEWLIREGSIRGQTAFDITAENGIRAGGHFAIREGDIALPDGEINGIEFALPYRYINNRVELIKHPVEVFVRQIKNGALKLENLRVTVRGYYPYSRRQPLELSRLSVDVLGGQLSINKLMLPQQHIADLHLQRIDLAQTLALLQYNQISMSGKINAVFPFWLEGKSCVICNGKISQAEQIKLKLHDEVKKGLRQGGITESILVDLVSDMDLQQLRAGVDLLPDGMMLLKAEITGYNPGKRSHNPITLNYNHRENVYELWELIDYGSQFEQKLEYDIYRKLEKKP